MRGKTFPPILQPDTTQVCPLTFDFWSEQNPTQNSHAPQQNSFNRHSNSITVSIHYYNILYYNIMLRELIVSQRILVIFPWTLHDLCMFVQNVCICCALTGAVCRRGWKRRASIFIQCLYEPDVVDWLNACHIDTPVVSPIGPQRHNGIGPGEPVCPYALGCRNSVTCWHCRVGDSLWFDETICRIDF